MSDCPRFWYQPNIGSKDLMQLLDDPSQLKDVDVMTLYAQNILYDEVCHPYSDNIFPNLHKIGAFRKLQEAGILLAIEAGCIKPQQDFADRIADIEKIVSRVRAAGGDVHVLAMDEPLTGNHDKGNATAWEYSLEKCGDLVGEYIDRVRSFGVRTAWLEAWPTIPFDEMTALLDRLLRLGTVPDFWRLDIDWNTAKRWKQDPRKVINDVRRTAGAHDIAFGIFINSTVEPMPTEAAHHANLIELAHKIYGICPDVPQLSIGSFGHRTKGGPMDIPNNLGRFGLCETYAEVARVFRGSTTIKSEEKHQESNIMFCPVTEPSKAVIVRSINPVRSSKSLFTLTLPDGRVFSQQPDGRIESRDPGTQGDYEACRVTGSLATFEPTPGVYFTRQIVVISEP